METRGNGIHSDREALLSSQKCTSTTQEHALEIETRITCKLQKPQVFEVGNFRSVMASYSICGFILPYLSSSTL